MLNIIQNLIKSFFNEFLFRKKDELQYHSNEEEKIHSVFAYLAEINKQNTKPSHGLQFIRSYKNRFPKINLENYEEFLSEVSVHFSLRLNTVSKSLEEIRNYVTPDSPFLIFYPDTFSETLDVYSITSYHAGAYKISKINESYHEEWISEKDILSKFNIGNSKEKIKWIVSEPLYAFSNKKQYNTNHLKNAINQIIHLIRLEKRDIWIIFIYGVGIGILSLVIPIATSSLVNIVSFGVLIQPVIVLTLLVVFFLGFAGTMQVIQTYVVEILQRRVFVRIATEFAAKFPRIKQEAFQNYHKPELANRFFDTMTIQKSINTLLVDGLSVVLTTIIGFLLIGIYHPVFLIFDFFILIIGGYYIIYKMGKASATSYLNVSKEKYKVAAWIEEIARHSATFHSNLGLRFGLNKADFLVRDYIFARDKYFKNLIRQIIGLIILQAIASAIVLGLGGYLVIHRQLTIGQLVAAELVIAKVLSDISKFGKQLDSFYTFIAAVDKIDEVFQLPLLKTGTIPFIPTEKPIEVELSNIYYTPPNQFELFSNLSFNMKSKSATGLKFTNPFEASVLLDLISSIRAPDKGTVFFDKQDIYETDFLTNHDDCILIRGNEIFEGSILENLCLGNDNISLIEIRELLEKLNFWNVINQLPEGLHSKLQTFGYPLNTVNKSMLQITRAILCSPRLLMIDQTLDGLPSEFLDPALKILLGKDRNWTLIVSSKSNQILSRMDQILSFENTTNVVKLNSQKGGV